jgi:hypothetical protein
MKKFLPSLAIVILASVVAFPLFAEDEVILKEGHPDNYTVKEGDTLWEIASMFLTDAWLWPEIWDINPAIDNPHLIYPGDNISLNFVGGEPRLNLKRGDASRTYSMKRTQKVRQGDRNEKLDPSVRVEPLVSAIPAIPLDAISSMLPVGRIVEQHTLSEAPYILAGRTDALAFGPGDEFYARGNWEKDVSVYGIFREGSVYQDPETNEVLGFEARIVGLAKVIKRSDDLLTFRVTQVKEDVRPGDRLLETELRKVDSTFYPKAPEQEMSGVIMNVFGGMTQVGRNDVVILNLGLEDGLEVGHVLAVHKSGLLVRDKIRNELVRLPSERSGLIMIYRSFEKMAYALVLQTGEPLRVGDAVLNP